MLTWCLYAESQLHPMVVALHILGLETRQVIPHGVGHTRITHVVLEVGISVAHTTVHTVEVVLVFQQVIVHSHTEIRSTGLIRCLRSTVYMVAMSVAQFYNREIAVAQVHPHSTLHLSVVAEKMHGGTEEVGRQGHATKQRQCVGLFHYFLHLLAKLSLCRYGTCPQHKANQECGNKCGNVLSASHSLP